MRYMLAAPSSLPVAALCAMRCALYPACLALRPLAYLSPLYAQCAICLRRLGVGGSGAAVPPAVANCVLQRELCVAALSRRRTHTLT
jgi:hypothetical protein